MRKLKIVLSKVQLPALILANLIVLIPFVGWMTIAALLPPDYLMSIPRVVSVSFFLKMLFLGLACCVAGNLLIGLPTLYRLESKIDQGIWGYLSEIMIWVLAWSSVLALVLAVISMDFAAFFLGLAVLIVALTTPSWLIGLIYRYVGMAGKLSKSGLFFTILLFLIWNLAVANLAAVIGAD